ncbi:hypothetical protein BU26DRAFT_517853 [Trematosphaeria pertusa]|uniref:Uncharacterized protein n=1 Tax=Trematosphaeria pertusa TaxID=390896 RepID=A0A6A6IKJ1_9PLEO|nr:uncharacterized protein BU26DRAFT_517853 [Trematosphaeria pertusa]KAF2251134.1 hypothetical protein BU26DRAFT_517853 [Trematosphaeria pertusa]
MRPAKPESDGGATNIDRSQRRKVHDNVKPIKNRWEDWPPTSGPALAEHQRVGYRMDLIAHTASESANGTSPQTLSTLMRYERAASPLKGALEYTLRAVTPLMGALNHTFRAGVPLPGTSFKYVTFHTCGGCHGVFWKVVSRGHAFLRCPPPLPPPEPYTTGQTQ